MIDAPRNGTGHPPQPRHGDRWHREGETVSLVRPAREARPVPLAAAPEPIEIDVASSAFVIIDMQNDFLHPEGWFAATRGVDVSPLTVPIPTINALSEGFRAAGAPVIHVNWGVRQDVANLPANVLDKGSGCGRWPGYGDPGTHGPVLVSGEWGARSVDAIAIEPADLVVHKHRLSGFRDNELDQVLRRLGTTTLFYAGVNLDRCVFATLTDGAFQGFDSVLVTDACATVSPPFVGEAVLYLVRLLYGFTATGADVLKALADSSSPAT